MIPIIIITENNSSTPYFETMIEPIQGTILSETIGKDGIRFTFQNRFWEWTTNTPKLRDKVLELLHKEVAECFFKTYDNNQLYEIRQTKFQIYLKDVIKKAEGSL